MFRSTRLRPDLRFCCVSLNLQPVGGSHSPVPKPGVFHRALLIAEVHIDKAVALTVTVGPFEIVEQTPCMKSANVRSISYGAGQLRKLGPEKLDSTCVRNMTIFFFIRRVQITAAALCNFDDGMVIFLADLHYQVVDATRPHFEPCVSQRTFHRHLRMETSIGISSPASIAFNLGA